MPYEGTEEATPERVRAYLRAQYTDTDGSPLSDARLTELLTEHATHMRRAGELGSFAYWAGDKIAAVAGLPGSL
jgi:hypothetical protein